MLVFIPAGIKEIHEKEKWFEKTVCRELRQRGIGFGFQIQGSLDGLSTSHPFGIHFPHNFATEWRNENARKILDELVRKVSTSKSLYAVVHGNRVCTGKDYPESPSENQKKYISEVDASDYLQAVEDLEGLIVYLKNLGIKVVLENVAFTNFTTANGIYQPQTYLDIRIGSLLTDMHKIKKKIGCELLFDIEHFYFAWNFASRKYNYDALQGAIPDKLSESEETVIREYGIFLRKGFVPIIPEVGNINEEIRKISSKIYHINGCPSGEYMEIIEDRVASHAPISIKDECFRQNLRIILKQKPEILVMEVAGPKDNPCWADRPMNIQVRSFENLCKILTEEL